MNRWIYFFLVVTMAAGTGIALERHDLSWAGCFVALSIIGLIEYANVVRIEDDR